MLLLTSARMENQGFLWNSTQTQMVSVGGTRALCEPVKAIVKLKWADSDSLMVFSLNERGQRAESLAIKQMTESADFTLDKNTLWYEISNQKISRISQVGLKPSINESNNFLEIHPNPAKDQATVEFSFVGQQNGRFLLFNSMGQLIQNELIQFSENIKNEKQLNTTNLQNGLYFCGFKFENGESVLEKLIVSH